MFSQVISLIDTVVDVRALGEAEIFSSGNLSFPRKGNKALDLSFDCCFHVEVNSTHVAEPSQATTKDDTVTTTTMELYLVTDKDCSERIRDISGKINRLNTRATRKTLGLINLEINTLNSEDKQSVWGDLFGGDYKLPDDKKLEKLTYQVVYRHDCYFIAPCETEVSEDCEVLTVIDGNPPFESVQAQDDAGDCLTLTQVDGNPPFTVNLVING